MLTQRATGVLEEQVLHVLGQTRVGNFPQRKEDFSTNQVLHFEEMSRAGCTDGSLLSRKFGTRDLGFIYWLWALLFCQMDFFIVSTPAVISSLMLPESAGLRPEKRWSHTPWAGWEV